MAEPKERGVMMHNPADDCEGLFMHIVSYEADSKVVYLCNQYHHDQRPAAILSSNVDVLACC